MEKEQKRIEEILAFLKDEDCMVLCAALSVLPEVNGDGMVAILAAAARIIADSDDPDRCMEFLMNQKAEFVRHNELEQ